MADCLALILDALLVNADELRPIARRFDISRLAEMLKNYDRDDEKVRDILKYYNKVMN